MKVTALIPDELVEEVKRYSKGKNITESLIRALEEWLALEKIKELNEKVDANPLKFQKGFTGEKIRKINRRKRW
ncbi:MAG: DUF2191 domain-containing protein [Candidatus Dadabacteria bacterium]